MLAAVEPLLAPRLKGARIARWVGTAAFAIGFVAFVTGSHSIVPFIILTGLRGYSGGRMYQASMTALLVGGPLLYQWSSGGCWRILDNRALRWFGSRTYSFYLIHFVVLAELAPHLHVGGYKREFQVLAPLAFAITAVLAELSYRTVEVPFRRFGKTFAWRRPPVPMPTKSVEPPKVPNIAGAVGGARDG